MLVLILLIAWICEYLIKLVNDVSWDPPKDQGTVVEVSTREVRTLISFSQYIVIWRPGARLSQFTGLIDQLDVN